MRYPKLPEVGSMYGAPMGRQDSTEEPDEPIRFHLYRMHMVDYAYDTGGAYWGAGDHKMGWMYHAYGEGPKFVNEMFVRARTRDEAKQKVRVRFTSARFYR